MNKPRILDIVFLSALLLLVAWCASVIGLDILNPLEILKGATAECKCNICSDMTHRKDECYYTMCPPPSCSTTECTVTWQKWGQCPEMAGGAECPLQEDPNLYSYKFVTKDGPPADCATASTSGVWGPPTSDCSPGYFPLLHYCVIPAYSCGGSITDTTYLWNRDVCDL